ncbi:MAG: hypothetical protein JO353_03535, partial [Phycisphaerae bacterium]|nr:hypothetical protein [Phycisphaerae bacterium]
MSAFRRFVFSGVMLLGAVLADAAATTRSTTELPMITITPRSRRCQAAIDGAVQFLLRRQLPNGGWFDKEGSDSQGGKTSLVTL